MENFSFEVTTDLSVMNPTQIESNYAECKAWLTEALAPYKGLIITEDAISDGKSIRANIRKVKDAINAQKVSVKKQWNAPLDTYLAQCNELVAMCDETASAIDGQIKDFENRQADEKIEKIKAAYLDAVSNVSKYAPAFETLVNPKWRNKGYSLDTAIAEVRKVADDTVSDMAVLMGMSLEFKTAVIDEYIHSHDLRRAIDKENALKALREAEAAKANIVEPPPAENAAEKPYGLPHEDFAPIVGVSGIHPVGEPAKPKTTTLRFEITTTIDKFKALRRFFDENGIDYIKL